MKSNDRAMKMKLTAAAAVAAMTGWSALPQPSAAAELELSLYGGIQGAKESQVSGRRANATTYSNLIHWDGKSFAMPPYYGGRATWWRDNGLGFGIEITHAKVYSPLGDMPAGFTRLEFTDGHNIATFNVLKRWDGKMGARLTPYVGAGLGVAVPHVDVTENGNHTYGYQLTGPALRGIAGVKYDLNDRWALFAEAQVIWSDNKADLVGGGSLKTTVTEGAVNFGVSYSF